MRKENVLVVIIICIAVASVMLYKNFKSAKTSSVLSVEESSLNKGLSSATIDWQDYEQGLAKAQATGKHIFLYFHADWCTYCVKLKKTTFKNKAVLTYLRDNFISISVDTDKNTELSKQWKVKGLPTLWFLKPDNSKISSIPGYVDKKQFLNILKYIHTQSYDKLSFNEFLKTI